MKELKIGDTLIRKRKEKGITQDELAKFIGVTKASVSKWETGHSYPDVIFLPQLAAYFNISVDELIGYEPQMTDADIRRIYVELINDFAEKPFEIAANRCRELVRKYYSCFPLLYQIAALMGNYGLAFKDTFQKNTVITEAKLLFIRVKKLSGSIELKRLALQAEASCEMLLDNPEKVVLLLANENRTMVQPSIGVLLSQANKMLGNSYEAHIMIQESIYDGAMILFNDAVSYLSILSENEALFEEACNRIMSLNDVFRIGTLSPMSALSFYMSAAEGYAALGNKKKALAMLESYTEIAIGDLFPRNIKTDNFLTLLNDIRERQLKENPFVMPQLPRDENAIRQEIISAVTENTVFSDLSDETRYKMLTEKLRTINIV